jgi:hypothetical protein
MATDHNHEHADLHRHNPEVGTERSDVNVGGIVGFGAGLALCTALVCLVLYGVFALLRNGFTQAPPNANALVGTREPVAPEKMPAAFPSPRLQVNYFGDLAAMRKDWNEKLQGYYWVDKNAGVVHIPIGRAIELTAQRGLPSRSEEQPKSEASVREVVNLPGGKFYGGSPVEGKQVDGR